MQTNFDPPKSEGSLLMIFFVVNCPKAVFDSSKKTSLSTECNEKNHSSLQSMVLKKIKKNLEKMPILTKTDKICKFLKRFFVIVTETLLCEELWFFCVAFSASGRFFSGIKNSFFTIFQIFHHKGPTVKTQIVFLIRESKK